MDSMPLVSVLLCNYNYGCFLGEAIDSVLNQTYPRVELVVVDDGSTDISRSVIASYGDRIVSVLKKNEGQAAAQNTAFASSHGEILCFLDSDDKYVAEKIDEIVKIFMHYPDIGSCFHSMRLFDSNGMRGAPQPMELAGLRDFRADILAGRMPFITAATSSLCFRRPLLEGIFPTPTISSMPVSGDHYLKWVSLALMPTYFLDRDLSLQRIHGANLYTSKHNRLIEARHRIITACWLQTNYPMLHRWADKVFAAGLGSYWREGGPDKQFHSLSSNYLKKVTLKARVSIFARAWGYRIGMDSALVRVLSWIHRQPKLEA